jgi:hypothetical protein
VGAQHVRFLDDKRFGSSNVQVSKLNQPSKQTNLLPTNHKRFGFSNDHIYLGARARF